MRVLGGRPVYQLFHCSQRWNGPACRAYFSSLLSRVVLESAFEALATLSWVPRSIFLTSRKGALRHLLIIHDQPRRIGALEVVWNCTR